jgi:hypothetical protein
LAGKTGAERRETLRDVAIGKKVSRNGVEKTRLSREEKSARTLAWATSLTEDQREQFLLGERFEALSNLQQEAISVAVAEATDREYSASIGIEDVDYDAPTPDLDSIVGSADEDEGDEVADDDYDALFQNAEWESERHHDGDRSKLKARATASEGSRASHLCGRGSCSHR